MVVTGQAHTGGGDGEACTGRNPTRGRSFRGASTASSVWERRGGEGGAETSSGRAFAPSFAKQRPRLLTAGQGGREGEGRCERPPVCVSNGTGWRLQASLSRQRTTLLQCLDTAEVSSSLLLWECTPGKSYALAYLRSVFACRWEQERVGRSGGLTIQQVEVTAGPRGGGRIPACERPDQPSFY